MRRNKLGKIRSASHPVCVSAICLVVAVQLVTKVIRDRRLVTSKLTWCSTKRGGILSQATTPLLYLVPFGLCCYCQIGERIGHVKDLTCHLLLGIPNGQEYQKLFLKQWPSKCNIRSTLHKISRNYEIVRWHHLPLGIVGLRRTPPFVLITHPFYLNSI